MKLMEPCFCCCQTTVTFHGAGAVGLCVLLWQSALFGVLLSLPLTNFILVRWESVPTTVNTFALVLTQGHWLSDRKVGPRCSAMSESYRYSEVCV